MWLKERYSMTKKSKKGVYMKKMIIILGILFVVSIFVPVRYALREEDISDGVILKVEQTTGPWWRITEIVGDNEHNLSVNELVFLREFDPYERLSPFVITSFQNTFFITVSSVEMVYDEIFEDYFYELTIENWDICYPIVRDLRIFSYSRRYLNIYDFRWFSRGGRGR